MLIKNTIQRFISQFPYDRKNYSANKTVESYQIAVEVLPKLFLETAALAQTINVIGSIGKGNITDNPWICFLDNEITTSVQDGYYVSLLFRTDMSGFYLSLNQGWTQYERKYGAKKGRDEIQINAAKARSLLRSIKGFDSDILDLRTYKTLGRGYELGNIYSRLFKSDELPDDKKLIADIQLMLGAYRELKGLVGHDILNIQYSASEDDFQEAIQETQPVEPPQGPVPRSDQKTSSKTKSWRRNPSYASEALVKAKYTCEFDASHKTFVSNSSGLPFVEAHHLIPMEKQSDFINSLDVPENIVALCPNCHRQIHLASKFEKIEMIEKFFNMRKEKLIQRGIEIDLNKLNIIYKQINEV